MRIAANELTAGDVLQLNDWRLHVVAVERDVGTAVLTAEFDFILHFRRDDAVQVVRSSSRQLVAAAAASTG